jgi:integrase
MAIRKIKNRYYIYYRDQDGKHRTLSLGTSDPEKAKAEHNRVWALIQSAKVATKALNRHAMIFPDAVVKEIEQANPIPPRVPREKKRLKLNDMIQVAQQYRDIAEDSIKAFDRFIEWCGNRYNYAIEITPQVALEYLEDKYGLGNGKSFNNNKSILNTIFRCCLVRAEMEQSPFACFPNKKVRVVENHRPLSDNEFRLAFDNAIEPWKTASLISWHTALRLESCFRLAWEHISVENDIPSITIVPGKTARFGRAVYIPIHVELWEWLNKLPRPADDKTPILSQFPMVKEWSRENRVTYYVGLLRSLGINDNKQGKASFHSLRSSFITRCDENGVSRLATRGVAGQVHDNITDLYSHDKRSALAILQLPSVGIFNK